MSKAKTKWLSGSFITIPNKEHVFSLTHGQLKVYLALCDMAGTKGKCWPSYQTIANRVGLKRRAVMYCVAELAEAGFIEVVSKLNNHSNHYKIVELSGTPDSWTAQIT